MIELGQVVILITVSAIIGASIGLGYNKYKIRGLERQVKYFKEDIDYLHQTEKGLANMIVDLEDKLNDSDKQA